MPQRIGRYHILRELGRGAMGVVYLADDPTLKRQVAIKTISLAQELSPRDREEARRRFLREAQAAAGLIHPGIVLILDVGVDAGDLFIAMEYIQGATLEEFTSFPDLLPVERSLQHIAEACEALDLAHRQKIVHRDLKPANLMVADGERLKITDFGLAKDPSTSLTHTGTLVGTPSYMSPEQIQGRELDGRSDLFSLGIVLYELLTGEKPFPGDSISTVIYRVLHEEPALPSQRNPAVPPILDALVLRALHKNPVSRFQTGAEFSRALRDPAAFAARHPPAAITQVRGALPGAAAESVPVRTPRRMPPRPAAPPPRRQGGVMKGLVLTLVALALIGFALTAFVPRVRDLVRGRVMPRLLAILPSGLGGHAGGPPAVQLASDEFGVDFLLEGRPLSSDRIPWRPELAGAVVEASDGCRRGERVLPQQPGRELFHVPLTEPVRRRLTLATDPPGATVILDGEERTGRTPGSYQVDACVDHQVSLELAGYRPGRIWLPEDGDWDSLTLGTVRLSALPEGSLQWESPYTLTVYAGDRRLGTTDETLLLPPGRHSLTLANEAHRVRLEQEVEVKSGARQLLRAEPPPLGDVRVNAYPGNASILIDGIAAGPPPLKLRLGEGEHEVQVRWNVGEPRTVRRIVTIRAGDSNPPLNFKQGS